MPSSLDWLHRTFSSRAATEQLLGPELENGLTTHDYELALRFLPGPPSYLPFGYGFFTSSLAVAYGRLYRRPPWSLARASFIAGFAGFAGVVYGQVKRAQAHWVFSQSLENPSAFMQALESVNKKTGGVRPLGFTLRNTSRPKQPLETNADADAPETTTVEFVQDEDWNAQGRDRPSKNENPQPASASPPRRWEQIRAANARSATQNSSWDTLRQRYERERVRHSRTEQDDDGVSEDPRSNAGPEKGRS